MAGTLPGTAVQIGRDLGSIKIPCAEKATIHPLHQSVRYTAGSEGAGENYAAEKRG
jgi:hypothetical protein